METTIKNALIQGLKYILAVTAVAAEDHGDALISGSGTLANFPVVPGSFIIKDPDTTAEDLYDQGDGTLVSASDGGVGTIDYATGDYTFTFGTTPGAAATDLDYSHGAVTNILVSKNRATFAANAVILECRDGLTGNIYQVQCSVEKMSQPPERKIYVAG